MQDSMGPEPLDHSSVTVPLKPAERDHLLLDMYGRVVRMETKVEAISDHEDRIRKVERRVWALPSSIFVAALAALGLHIGN